MQSAAILEQRYSRALILFLLAAAIGYYLHFLYQYALNIPLGDDVIDVLLVINGVEKAQSTSDIFPILLAQHNDHRTLSSRLIYWAAYLAEGEVNFRTLTFIANTSLLVLLALLCRAIPGTRYRWLITLTAALLLFHIRTYDLTLWPMAGFAYFSVFAYGFAALYCLDQATPVRLAAGIILATLCTFTLASGQLVWLVGVVSLLRQALLLKRIPLHYVLSWLVAATLVLLMWQAGLETPNTLATLLQHLWNTPLGHLRFFLALLGSAVSEKSLVAAYIASTAMLTLLLWSTVRNFRQERLWLELAAWFIVLSTAALAFGRAPYTILEYALTSRYGFPSVIMLSTCWVLCASRFLLARPAALLAAAALAGIYCVTCYTTYSPILQSHLDNRVERFNRDFYWIFGRPAGATRAIVEEAIVLGVYQPPAKPHPAVVID